MSLDWGIITNIESSLEDFLTAQATVDAVDVQIRVGEKFDSNWALPTIQVYVDSKLKPRGELGSNKRENKYIVIIEVRATNAFERANLADWAETSINNGFTYYSYSANLSDPDNPQRVSEGHADLDFISSGKVNLGDNVSEYDKWRYRISFRTWIPT